MDGTTRMRRKVQRTIIALVMAAILLGGLYCPAGSVVEAKDGEDTTTAQMRQELEAAFGDADAALQKAAIAK